MLKLHKIRFNVRPTGLLPDKEDELCRMLEGVGEESMRAIGCIETFIIPKDDEKKEIPKIICNVRPTGLPPEEEDRLCEMLKKAADEARRAIG